MNLIYETSHVGFWIKVYDDRVEFFGMVGTKNIPIEQIASIQLAMMGHWQIIIETTGGKKYRIPCKHKKEVRDAIYKAKSSLQTQSGSQTHVADELLKLKGLLDDGVITKEEFEQQKDRLLSK